MNQCIVRNQCAIADGSQWVWCVVRNVIELAIKDVEYIKINRLVVFGISTSFEVDDGARI